MKIIRQPSAKLHSEHRTETFSGEVWMHPILEREDGVLVGTASFAPGSRTYWHSHAQGQFLHVLAGEGQICTEQGTPQRITAGDMVWAPPGEVHWHGATEDSFMIHTAVSLGDTTWLTPVDDAE